MALTKVDISLVDNATGFTLVTKVVTVAASKLVTDGVSQDTLTLTEGYTYKFDTSHATMSGHTFAFATAADAAGSTQYTTGVTTNGTPGNAGAYTQIVVAASAPTLYYYCANHASMGGTANTPAAVIANKLLAYDASGNLPAVDGSLITGVVSSTLSASSPTVSTNPSTGVGTEWINTTSGDVYICTNATSNANIWTNVGFGRGSVQSYIWQGTQYGYVSGGWGGSNPRKDNITRHSFASDGNASDGGNLTLGRNGIGGAKSTTHGYVSGGNTGGSPPYQNVIDRFAFANFSSNASDVGDLTKIWSSNGGHSTSTYGYMVGGNSGTPPTSREAGIEKYQLAASASGITVGELTQSRSNAAMTQSTSHGYTLGGFSGGPSRNHSMIDKFSFSTDAGAAKTGELTTANEGPMGVSSSTHGYCCGGYRGAYPSPPLSADIDKISFASDGNAVAYAGDQTTGRGYQGQGNQSTTHGYNEGGQPGISNVIDKFSFASEGNATDVGDLVTAVSDAACVSY